MIPENQPTTFAEVAQGQKFRFTEDKSKTVFVKHTAVRYEAVEKSTGTIVVPDIDTPVITVGD